MDLAERHASPSIDTIIAIVGETDWYNYRVEFRRLVTLPIYSSKSGALSEDFGFCLTEWGDLSKPLTHRYLIEQFERKVRIICWMCGKTDLSGTYPQWNRHSYRLMAPGSVCLTVLNSNPSRCRDVVALINPTWYPEANEIINHVRNELRPRAETPLIEQPPSL